MKIAFIADLHLNKKIYKGIMDKEFYNLPFKSADFIRSFEYIVNICINEINPDLIVIGGDTYDTSEPSNDIRGFFSKQLKKISDAKIPVLILIGNHDICVKNHALKDIQELGLKNVKVVEIPTFFDSFNDELNLLVFPYSMDVEQKKKTIKEEFYSFVDSVKNKTNGKPSLFFGHFALQNAVMGEYLVKKNNTESEQQEESEDEEMEEFIDKANIVVENSGDKKLFLNKNPNDISITDLNKLKDASVDCILLGDFHTFQKINEAEIPTYYAGSIEKNTFKDMDESKGFILYDSKAKDKCKFIEYPNCRQMLKIQGNYKEIINKLEKVDSNKYKNAIVKISFFGNTEEFIEFASNSHILQESIKSKLDPIHLIISQKTKTDEKIKQEVQKIEDGFNGEIADGYFIDGSQDIIETAKEMIIEKINKDEVLKQSTIDLMVKIYKESIGISEK